MLYEKGIKAQRFAVFSENDTAPQKSWVWEAVEWSQLGHCSKVSGAAFNDFGCLSAGPPFLSHVPIAFQSKLNFIFLMYSLIQSYLCICSVLAACICDSAPPGPVLVP